VKRDCMEKQEFDKIIEELNEFEGVEMIYLINSKAEIIFQYELTKQEPLEVHTFKTLIKAWKEKEPSIIFRNQRYAILKSEELQFAAKNTTEGKGNLCGSITKDGDYLIAHISGETGLSLLEWSVLVNKRAFSI